MQLKSLNQRLCYLENDRRHRWADFTKVLPNGSTPRNTPFYYVRCEQCGREEQVFTMEQVLEMIQLSPKEAEKVKDAEKHA